MHTPSTSPDDSQPWDYDSAARRPRWREEADDLLANVTLVSELVSRDLKVRYKRSIFGALWSMAAPAGMAAVLSVLFAPVLGSSTPLYALFVFPGLLVWNFFSQTTGTVIQSVALGVDLWRRVRMPTTAFAIATTISALIHLFIPTVLLVAGIAVMQHSLNWALLTIPLAALAVALFTVGIAMIVSAGALYFPDIGPLYQSILPVAIFATPVVYPVSILSPRLQRIVACNPMTWYVDAFRMPIYEHHAASLTTFALALGLGACASVAGWVVYTRCTDDIPYGR